MLRLSACIHRVVAACLAVLVLGAVPAQGQENLTERSSQDLLEDFGHYVLIANYELAEAAGQELLGRAANEEISLTEYVDLVENTEGEARFLEVVSKAARDARLEATAAGLRKMWELGKLARVRDPAEVARNIQALTGNIRGRLLARNRLIEAGEYAFPQILTALLDGRNPAMQAEVNRLLIDMGQQSVVPLCTALPGMGQSSQARVASILGQVGSRTALPFLFELRQSPSDEVKRSANQAIEAIGARGTEGATVAQLFRALAEQYYDEAENLTSFPGEPSQLLWRLGPADDLQMGAIATEVYHEAMAMRFAEKSLRLEPTDASSLALWIAANFSREIDSPEGYVNPTYPADKRDAMYFAVAAGPAIDQGVLARALDNLDTPLARRAIAAVEKTAGGTSLWRMGNRQSPLMRALVYPNRRVQYESALALAASSPSQNFDGAERVVPVLASAVRDASQRFVLVLSDSAEEHRPLRGMLEDKGYTVLAFARTLDDAAPFVADVPGVDFVVLHRGATPTTDLIDAVRTDPRLSATPILAIVPREVQIRQARAYEGDVSISIRARGISQGEFGAAVDQLVEVAAGGPVTAEEARGYKDRSLTALRDLAISGNAVLDVTAAVSPLTAALREQSGSVRMRIAEILSMIGMERAQVALADAAIAAEGAERVALLGHVARSAKRFGNMLDPRTVSRIVEMVSADDDAEATAAAALMGSLSLPNESLLPLILD